MALGAPLLAACCAAAAPGARPNLVLVLTDDVDVDLLARSPAARRLAARGTSFAHAYANTPVCCPSRATLLTGRHLHNTRTLNNSLAGGCAAPGAWQRDAEPHALAPRLSARGYACAYLGKYLNNQHDPRAGGVGRVPPGWSRWLGLVGNSRYYNYTLSADGTAEPHADADAEYLPDLLGERAARWLREQRGAPHGRSGAQRAPPFLLVLALPSAHAPFTPARRHQGAAAGARAPRGPAWNRTAVEAMGGGPGCHAPVRDWPPLSARAAATADAVWRARLEVMRGVDDVLDGLHAALSALALLPSTYVLLSSDHGFHAGQRASPFDKRLPYEHDTRAPLLAAGPCVRRGAVRLEPVGHVDLVPTLLALADAGLPAACADAAPAARAAGAALGAPSARPPLDGSSWAHALFEQQPRTPGSADVLFEYRGEGSADVPITLEGAGRAVVYTAAARALAGARWGVDSPTDGLNNSYSCVRTVGWDGAHPGTHAPPRLARSDVLCEFTCFDAARAPTPCPAGTPEGWGEYYDLRADPAQLSNSVRALGAAERARLSARLRALERCVGAHECRGGAPPTPDDVAAL